ncbi:MAG: DUF2752 domain-containing protein [Rhodothermales bacterium]|nr:DUF2752 domain-containing protein [Rhodothermales bacterium]
MEGAFWLAGLTAVALMDPASTGGFTVCPFDHLGAWLDLSFCPGCGLGHAVGFLARGEVVESLKAHPLGVPAVLILSSHVWRLFRTSDFTSR